MIGNCSDTRVNTLVLKPMNIYFIPSHISKMHLKQDIVLCAFRALVFYRRTVREDVEINNIYKNTIEDDAKDLAKACKI